MKKLINSLKAFSNRHDKLSHLVLAFAITFIGVKFAVGFVLSIELTQIDVLGIAGRIPDTLGDLVADGAGIGLALLVLKIVKKKGPKQ